MGLGLCMRGGEAFLLISTRSSYAFDLNFLCADMFPYEDSKTVSVCPSVRLYPEKRNHPGFVNISFTVVNDVWMDRSSRVLQHGNPKFWISLKKSKLNFFSFVDISPTLVGIWYINGKLFTSSLSWEVKNVIF